MTVGTLAGSSPQVNALAVWDPDGPGPRTPVLVIGGTFTYGVGPTASNVAAWDPATSSLSQMGGIGQVFALSVNPGGEILAVGNLQFFENATVRNDIARWNGTSWSSLATGGWMAGAAAYSVLPLSNGDVLVGGSFLSAGYGTGQITAHNLARCNGTAWSTLASGFPTPRSMLQLANGDVAVAGESSTVYRWNGSTWIGYGDLVNYQYALAVPPSGELVAGGSFSLGARYVARWTGFSWATLGTGTDGVVNCLAAMPNGNLIAGGYFGAAGGMPASHVARWDGSAWSPLGAGTNDTVRALAVLPNGDVAVGGDFTMAGGVPVTRVAIWRQTMPVGFARQPSATISCPTGSGHLEVLATGTGPLSYQWQVQSAPGAWINFGTMPVPLPCGGSAYATPGNAPAVTIDIHPCPVGVTGSAQRFQIRCMVSNPCGSATSAEATYTICTADFNCSGGVSVQDIFDFLAAWFAQDPRASLNHAGPPTVQDIFDFLAAWFSGC